MNAPATRQIQTKIAFLGRAHAEFSEVVFGDPQIAATNDSPEDESLLARLLGACDLYVASTADLLT